MDNRIPSVVRDFIQSNPSDTQIDFLSYNDWLSKKENHANDWTIVARNSKADYEDYCTISCLIKVDENSLKGFLTNSQWFISTEFGIPSKYQIPEEGEVYDDRTKAELNEVIYYPFSFSRYFNGYIPDYFQLIEHFLLYYNCFWVEDRREYQGFIDREIRTIVKHIKTDSEELIFIDTHILKDYLAVRNMHLARFHDHRRRSVTDISGFLEGKMKTYRIFSEDSFYELDLRVDIQYEDIKSTSRLLGKDIVIPYPKPMSYKILQPKSDSDFLEFVINRDDMGNEVKSTCNPSVLSNYFEDRETTHFLTPIYFKREMLQKYYAEPRKYTVSEFSIEYLNIWSIQIVITKEQLVQVYLGDVGTNLPYIEQLHWRQFNVVPKGKIPEHRFRRDFLNQFAFPEIEEAPIIHFKEAFELTQNKFRVYSGQALFKQLAKNDQHLYLTLHVPLTDEWKELDEQILAIAKITTDSFNYDILVKLTGKKIGDLDTAGKAIKGPTNLFYEFLNQITLNSDERIRLINPFNMIQSLRSSSVAHRKSGELEAALIKYGLNKLSNEEKFKYLIIELTKSLNVLVEKLG